MRLFSIKTKIF